MTTVTSLFAENITLSVMARSMTLVTVLVACAWVIARLAGAHNAAIRAHIWTAAMIIALCAPLFSWLCACQIWMAVHVPTDWLSKSLGLHHAANVENHLARDVPAMAVANDRISDSLNSPAVSDAVARNSSNKIDNQPRVAVFDEQRSESRYQIDARHVGGLLLMVWAFGVVAGLFRLAIAAWHATRMFRTTLPLCPLWHARIAPQVQRIVGLKRLPRLVVSKRTTIPLAGFHRFRGTVILPSELLNELSDSELQDIVVHECAHLRRYDPVIGMLQSLAAVLYWPHPFIHLAKLELTKSREEVCDNYVLRSSDAIRYSKTLLRIAERGAKTPSFFGMSPLWSNNWPLADRVEGLLSRERSTCIDVGRYRGASVLIFFCSIALAITSARLGTAQQKLDGRSDTDFEKFQVQAWHPRNVTVLGVESGRKWSFAGRGIDVSPNGEQVAVGGYPGVLYLWNAKTMHLEGLLKGHNNFVLDVHYTSDGNKLLSIGDDNSLLAWNLSAPGEPQSEKIAMFDEKTYDAVWSDDGSTLLIGHDIWRFSSRGELKKVARIPPANDQNSELPDHVKALAKSLNARSIATMINNVRELSMDGNQIVMAVGGKNIWIEALPAGVNHQTDSTVSVWRISGDAAQKRFDLLGVGYVQAIAFSPDGNTLAIGAGDGKARLFDIRGDTPRELHVLTCGGPVSGLRFDPQGKTLAIASLDIRLWNITADPPTAGAIAPLSFRPHDVLEMAFSRDGSTLFYVDGMAVRRWEVARTFVDADADLRVGSVVSQCVVPNRKQLLSVVDRNGGSEILMRDFESLAARPKTLVEWTDSTMDDLVVSPDGEQFVVSDSRKNGYGLQLWKRTDDKAKKVDSADLEIGYPGAFWCTAFAPDGNTLASGHRDGAIRLWDVANDRLRLRQTSTLVHWGGVGGLAYSPDGSMLATADWGGNIDLWETNGEQLRQKASLGTHKERSYTVRFSQDGRLLASGDYSGEIKLWPLDVNPPKATDLKLHTANITSLHFAATGEQLLSSGADGRVVVWDVKEARSIHEWQFPGHVGDTQFDPTGRRIISANGNGSIYVWGF